MPNFQYRRTGFKFGRTYLAFHYTVGRTNIYFLCFQDIEILDIIIWYFYVPRMPLKQSCMLDKLVAQKRAGETWLGTADC